MGWDRRAYWPSLQERDKLRIMLDYSEVLSTQKIKVYTQVKFISLTNIVLIFSGETHTSAWDRYFKGYNSY